MNPLKDRHPLEDLLRLFDDDRCYNKQGQQISPAEHSALRQDLSYMRIGNDLALSVYRVSTVWVGLPGCLFETLVWVEGPGFKPCDVEALKWVYQTEPEALAGHTAVVTQLNAGIDPRACKRPGAN